MRDHLVCKTVIRCSLLWEFFLKVALITRSMGPTWGPSGADRTQVGSLLASWTLVSGVISERFHCILTNTEMRQDPWSISTLTCKENIQHINIQSIRDVIICDKSFLMSWDYSYPGLRVCESGIWEISFWSFVITIMPHDRHGIQIIGNWIVCSAACSGQQ